MREMRPLRSMRRDLESIHHVRKMEAALTAKARNVSAARF